MAKRPRSPRTSRRDHESSAAAPDYAVGYGRPPLHSRFKTGQSGNPNGRPPQHLNLRTVLQEALQKMTEIREGGRTLSLSTLEALVVSMLAKAVKGDPKAQTTVIALLRSTGMTAEMPQPASTEPVTANDVEITADFLRRQRASTENAVAPEDEVDNRQNTVPNKGTGS
jgi:Family of unknown function (DUF5681)